MAMSIMLGTNVLICPCPLESHFYLLRISNWPTSIAFPSLEIGSRTNLMTPGEAQAIVALV
jgi:hypothetical protein